MQQLVSRTQKPSNKDNVFENKRFQGKSKELEANIGIDSQEEVKKSVLVEISTPTSRIIYKIFGVFPFDFVPDELVIDEVKVSIIYRGLFFRQVNSILIKDITDISLTSVTFFGAIMINGGEYEGLEPTKKNPKGPLKIKFLRQEEARTARRIIMGLMIFSDQKVDTSLMTVPEIIQKTQELGKTREVV